MKKMLLLATGGTIASVPMESGVAPSFDAERLLSFVTEQIKNSCQIYAQAILNVDSVNMNPQLVLEIAQTIFDNYHDFDGFVITHGTDSMAYTAALLTYTLQNLQKPVVLTGSQVPMGALHTDAIKNLADAIKFATEDIAGVFVVFDGKLINGTRANKFKTRSKNAFRSVNYPYVAEVRSGKIAYNQQVLGSLTGDRTKTPELKKSLCTNILLLKLYPGMNVTIFNYLKTVYKGIILESFGAGAVPCEDDRFNVAAKISELWDAGTIVVLTTQCFEDGVHLGEYKVGKALCKNKLILAQDMSTEALVAKLMWALGNLDSNYAIKKFMEAPVFGDITAP